MFYHVYQQLLFRTVVYAYEQTHRLTHEKGDIVNRVWKVWVTTCHQQTFQTFQTFQLLLIRSCCKLSFSCTDIDIHLTQVTHLCHVQMARCVLASTYTASGCLFRRCCFIQQRNCIRIYFYSNGSFGVLGIYA